MATFTSQQLREYELRRKADIGRKASGSKPEPSIRNEPVAKATGEAEYTDRFRVRIVSFRRRLLDPDNLCPKYWVDCLRYAGFIPNDRQEDIDLEVSQRKVASRDEERTELTVIPIQR